MKRALYVVLLLTACGVDAARDTDNLTSPASATTCVYCVPPKIDLCTQLVALRYPIEITVTPPLAPYETIVGRFWVDGAMTFSYYPPLASGGATYAGYFRPYTRYVDGGCGLLDRAGWAAARTGRPLAPVAGIAVWNAAGVRVTPATSPDGDALYFNLRDVY